MVVSEAVGVAVEVEDYRAVQEAVEHGCSDGGVTEHFAPFNWSWHMFDLAETPCYLGFQSSCVSYRSSRHNRDMLGATLTS